MFGLGLIIIVMALIIGGFYAWARSRGLLGGELPSGELPSGELPSGELPSGEQSADRPSQARVGSLLTEAVAYIGAILLLAGGAVALGQRWNDLGKWGQVGVCAGVTAFFLLVGAVLRGLREPAIQRLVGVVWLLSAAGVAATVGVATRDAHGDWGRITLLAVGVAVAGYSAVLWLIRRRAPQNLAMFAGSVITVCGAIVAIVEPAPALAFALALWAFGLVWAGLGWRRYVEPMWVSIPCGVVLSLVAPSFAIGEHGWVYAIAIVTAASAMASSVPLRNTPLLGVGTVAMFGYVTAVVVQYFGDSLGVPAALAITGFLIIALAVVTARLGRLIRPSRPPRPGARRPSPRHLSKTA